MLNKNDQVKAKNMAKLISEKIETVIMESLLEAGEKYDKPSPAVTTAAMITALGKCGGQVIYTLYRSINESGYEIDSEYLINTADALNAATLLTISMHKDKI